MPVAHIVTPEVLSKFKEPFGVLIEGSFSETITKFRVLLEKEKPSVIISVGDTVSRNLHAYNIFPQLSVTDNQSMRKKIAPRFFKGKQIIRVKNPQGLITQEAVSAIQKALQSGEHTHILVEGEEDLLTLVVVLYAPTNALVVYGQPSEGLVAVKVTAEKRAEALKIWSTMKSAESSS